MGSSGSKPSQKERRFLMEAHKLSPRQFDAVFRVFNSQAGKKGYLSFEQFCLFYASSRFEYDTSDQLAVFRALADSERLTLAGFVRFCQLCDRAGSAPESERLRVLFTVMDYDNSGTISQSEFCRFLANFVDDEVTTQGFFTRVDEDDSKLIDFFEFASFCRQHKRAYKLMCAYVFPPRQANGVGEDITDE